MKKQSDFPIESKIKYKPNGSEKTYYGLVDSYTEGKLKNSIKIRLNENNQVVCVPLEDLELDNNGINKQLKEKVQLDFEIGSSVKFAFGNKILYGTVKSYPNQKTFLKIEHAETGEIYKVLIKELETISDAELDLNCFGSGCRVRIKSVNKFGTIYSKEGETGFFRVTFDGEKRTKLIELNDLELIPQSKKIETLKNKQTDFPIGKEVEYWGGEGVLFGIVEFHPEEKAFENFVYLKLAKNGKSIRVNCEDLTLDATENESPDFPLSSLVRIRSLDKIATIKHPSDTPNYYVVRIQTEYNHRLVELKDLELLVLPPNNCNNPKEDKVKLGDKQIEFSPGNIVFIKTLNKIGGIVSESKLPDSYSVNIENKDKNDLVKLEELEKIPDWVNLNNLLEQKEVMDIRKMTQKEIRAYFEILEFTTVELSILKNKELKYLIEDYLIHKDSNRVEAFFVFIDTDPFESFNESYVGYWENPDDYYKFLISCFKLPSWLSIDIEKTSENLEKECWSINGYYFRKIK